MKKFLLAAIFAPLMAFAQTYPSPTFQNTTVLGTLTAATPSFTNPVPIASGGTGQATAAAAAHAFGVGTADTPLFTGLTISGSTAHGVTIGGGSSTPFSWTAVGTAGQPLLSGGASADPAYGTLGVPAGGTGQVSNPQYGLLVGNGASSISSILPSATTGYPLISNGSSAYPSFQQLTSAEVSYTAPLTGAVARSQQSKNLDEVSVLDFGADDTCTTDAAPAFRAAMAAVNYGGQIDIPAGCYLLNSATNNAILDFTPFPNKGINWKGVGWTLKTGGSFSFGTGTGPSGSILVIGSSISNTTDFYHQAPTDLVIGGVSFKDFAVVASTGAYGTPHGNNGFDFDGTANANGYIENMVMDDVFIDNFASGNSIFVNGTGNNQGVLAGADIRNSKFMSFQGTALGDSDTIEDNIIGANAGTTGAAGINFYNVSGATSTRILNNDMVNFNGMILVGGCTKCIIDGNEFEQPAGSSDTLGAMISFSGANGNIDNPTVTNNSFAQDSTVANYIPLYVAHTNGARISGNRFSTPSSYSQIQIDSTSSYNLVDSDNQSWVNGVAQAAVPVLDNGTKDMTRGQSWASYTPTVTAGSGTFTTVSAAGAYQLVGSKTLEIRIDITITTVGTASGTVNVTLPTGFAATTYEAFSGKEVASTGDGLAAYVPPGGNILQITNAAGAPIIGAGYHLVLNGTIEIQ